MTDSTLPAETRPTVLQRAGDRFRATMLAEPFAASVALGTVAAAVSNSFWAGLVGFALSALVAGALSDGATREDPRGK